MMNSCHSRQTHPYYKPVAGEISIQNTFVETVELSWPFCRNKSKFERKFCVTIIKFAPDTGSSNYLLPPTELILSAIIRMQIIPAGIQKKCKLSVKSAPPLSTGYW